MNLCDKLKGSSLNETADMIVKTVLCSSCTREALGKCTNRTPCHSAAYRILAKRLEEEAEKIEREMASGEAGRGRTAKWIKTPFQSGIICSACNHSVPDKFMEANASLFAYCPHCGAKMEN